jgi:hypothetical protein
MTAMFSNRISAEQTARCHAASRAAIGQRIACLYNVDLSENLPEPLQRLLDELSKSDAP